MEVADHQPDPATDTTKEATENISDSNTPVELKDVDQEPKPAPCDQQEGSSGQSTNSRLEQTTTDSDISDVNTEKPTEVSSNHNSDADLRSITKVLPLKEHVERPRGDEKLAMYKALAIKLKKELVKSRDELTKLKESSQLESNTLKAKVDSLEKTLSIERQTGETLTATLEAKIRTVTEQLNSTESELQSIQNEFESYKIMASKIMQQNTLNQSSSNKTFEEERYKQLKELSDDQKRLITQLESQLELSSKKSEEHSKRSQQLQDDIDKLRERLKHLDTIVERCEILSIENDNLKSALSQFRSKLRNPRGPGGDKVDKLVGDASGIAYDHGLKNDNQSKGRTTSTSSPTIDNSEGGVSPSTSIKDESQTNSSSSHDGSTSGYVHIKPATFEIISRASVQDDAHNQIVNLTKAYLDSESANSLLTEQVKTLKEEIEHLKRSSDRLVMAENFEYLKNVVLKFLSLDSSQIEKKQRLIPVISTVLKLSPDETAKLHSLANAERPSIASSFFKL